MGGRNRQIEPNDRETKFIVKRNEDEPSRQFLPREKSELGLELGMAVLFAEIESLREGSSERDDEALSLRRQLVGQFRV